MKVSAQTEQQILSAIDVFFVAYTKRDLPGVVAMFVPDPDVVLIGTESDERLVGLDAITERFRSDWSRTDEMSMEMRWYSLSGAVDVCWLAAEIMVSISTEGNKLQLPARITVVLERRAERWLIAHWHASMAVE
jgi:ketosteroid isomerase-like protein